MGWDTDKLGDLITMFGGGTPSKDREEYWNGDIPWATVKDLKSPRLLKTQDSISELGFANSSSKIVKAGSIIIATRMAVGRLAIPEIDVAINQDLKGIICPSELTLEYLFYFLLNQEKHFKKSSSGATVKGIKENHITDLKIPTPPADLQRKFSNGISLIEAQKQQAQASLQKSENLFNSLLQRAFKTDLTR